MWRVLWLVLSVTLVLGVAGVKAADGPEKSYCLSDDTCVSPVSCDPSSRTCSRFYTVKPLGHETGASDPPCGYDAGCVRACIGRTDIPGHAPAHFGKATFEIRSCMYARHSGWRCGDPRAAPAGSADCPLGWCRWADKKVTAQGICVTLKNWSDNLSRTGQVRVKY